MAAKKMSLRWLLIALGDESSDRTSGLGEPVTGGFSLDCGIWMVAVAFLQPGMRKKVCRREVPAAAGYTGANDRPGLYL